MSHGKKTSKQNSETEPSELRNRALGIQKPSPRNSETEPPELRNRATEFRNRAPGTQKQNFCIKTQTPRNSENHPSEFRKLNFGIPEFSVVFSTEFGEVVFRILTIMSPNSES